MKTNKERTIWLSLGIIGGLCIATLWPHEPVQAVSNDRHDKFALFTTEVSTLTPLEGVFVLDFLTGRLTGAVLNNVNGKFTNAYYRNVAADFGTRPGIDPQYAVVSGRVQLPVKAGISKATGAIYVAEFTSGKVAAYSFPYRISPRATPPMQLIPEDFFAFRQQAQE